MKSRNDQAPTTIIKCDRAGRPRYTPEYREEVLRAYEASGMSGPAFARHCGVKYPTLAGWVARRRRGANGSSPATARPKSFVLAEFSSDPGEEFLLVRLPGGACAELVSSSQVGVLAALIKALA